MWKSKKILKKKTFRVFIIRKIGTKEKSEMSKENRDSIPGSENFPRHRPGRVMSPGLNLDFVRVFFIKFDINYYLKMS